MNNRQIEIEEEKTETFGKCRRCGDPLTVETTPISDNPEHDGLCDYCANAWAKFE
jgi:hypothetical protein